LFSIFVCFCGDWPRIGPRNPDQSKEPNFLATTIVMVELDYVMPNRNWPTNNNITYTESSMELKVILKKLIKREGISVVHLSKSTKVPLPTLHGWLQGTAPKNLKQVKAVADYFGVDLDYLCFGVRTAPNLDDFQDEINAGIFEVVLRRVKK
jgi:hypothetical protein